jgi:ABC-2 type transport system ATP-binding protein
MAEPVVVTEDLTKQFGTLCALDGLDLEIHAGEVLGYLGPNGAGKTTTVRLLLDFLRPTRGRSRLLGGTGADPAIRDRVGYLPGELRVDPTYTATDLVEYYGALHGGVDRSLVASLLERFQLDPTRPYRELSTGNRRKVGIVQAFAHRPDLLLLDEPTSGLDPLLQAEFADLVRETCAGGATVVLSSHVVREVEMLAGRVAILRRGRLVTVLDIAELRRRARQRLELHLDGPADCSVFRHVPGVAECEATGQVVHLVVEGSVDQVIKAAARLPVRRIVTHETDLEDVFLGYYRDDT